MKPSFRALLLCGCLFAVCGGQASAQQRAKQPPPPPKPSLDPPPASAQERPPAPLYLSGVRPGGVRTTVTESWGAWVFELTNFTDTDRPARVFASYEDRPDVLYGREVWAPAHAMLKSWMLVGPAPPQPHEFIREIEMLLYDRSSGNEELILPRTEERIRGRGVPYRVRDPFTALMFDEDELPSPPSGQPPQPQSLRDEIFDLVCVFRQARNLSEYFQVVSPGSLPPSVEAFDGIDHFILASDRLIRDPAGLQVLRRWLQQGGKLWVMLDRVGPQLLAALLGDAFDFQIVDRIELTSFRVETRGSAGAAQGPAPPSSPLQEHDRPVEMVRILLPPGEESPHTVNDWPVWFKRRVGKGEVVFTALGARGLHRPRTNHDRPSRYPTMPFLPVAGEALSDVALELHPSTHIEPFSVNDFAPMLTEEIGYSIVGRGSAMLIFGSFLVGAVALGLVLRKARHPEWLGWLGPAAALGAATAFVLTGHASRRKVPPTVALAQIVHAVSGKEEAAAHGLLEVYRPDSGETRSGTNHGGFFDLDPEGLQGKSRRFLLTDRGAWHWDNLNLPAGVRSAPFHSTIHTEKPIAAVARFGPNGIEGKLTSEPFHELSDALLRTPSGRCLTVHLRGDGTFQAGGSDVLPQGEFLVGTVLSDRQQRRKEIYRTLLKRPEFSRDEEGNVLYAWANAGEIPFELAPPDARKVGNSLLVVPLRFEHSVAGQPVRIPGPLLTSRRITNGGAIRLPKDGTAAIDMHLRFQLPRCVLPFQLDRARLALKINAAGRRVTIAGRTPEGQLVHLREVDSPLDVIRMDITETRLLGLDAEGGLHLNLKLSDRPGGGANAANGWDKQWTIDYLDVETSGVATAP